MSSPHHTFQPMRWLKSGHLQTVGAFLFRGKRSSENAIKHTVPLHDGDRLIVHDDQPASWITGDRIAILFHGLCGCHSAPYVVRAADKLRRQGIRTIRVDMRGFGDSTLISKSHLHGGCYFDAESVVEFVNQLSPLSPISLIGYSIGGNIILRLLGQWANQPHPHVDSAIAVCPPIDLVECSKNLRHKGNRLYESYFVNSLSKQLVLRRKKVENLVDIQVSPLPKRLIHFDDQFTAPCWGYRGAMEYYRDASSTTLLKDISVPTVILAAKDDPVIPFSMFNSAPFSSYIDFVAQKHGGHLGFLSTAKHDPDRHWMDWRICEWITQFDQANFEYKERRYAALALS